MRRWLWIMVVIVVWSSPTTASAEWVHPVDREVTDGFRPPTSRFGAGNRGLEYATVGGEVVRAVDDGTVVFAGSVGRYRHVVVDHGDGLRSTYAYLRSPTVVRHQAVERGQMVAVADAGFHLTARLDDVYVDPLLLMNGAQVVIRLVPSDPPVRDGAGNPDRGRPNPILAALDAATDLRLSDQLISLAHSALEWHHRECTEDGVAVAATPGAEAVPDRILIQVGGLGSNDQDASIGALDHRSIGYEDDDVVGFSYAGGCTPEAFGGGRSSLVDEVGSAPYRPEDTFQPIESSASALADLVESVAIARPGQPIDIAAHSLGGVVTRRALDLLDERGSVGPVDVVITIGSPHGGADLATAAVVTSGSRWAEETLDPWIGDGADLREADSVIDIAEAGGGSVPRPGPPPPGVRAVAVAGGGDLVVAAEHARWEDATNVIIPTSPSDATSVHRDLPGMPEVQRELELAIAGLPPRCVHLAAVLGSALQGRAISAVEDGVTLLAGLARWVF